MGAGQSDLYKGTYGDKEENIPDCLKGKIKLPPNDSQLKHIFEERDGHLPDTPENRKLLEELANNKDRYKGKDKYGNDWNIRLNDDGTQDWVRSQHQVINEGGRNIEPRPWDDETGLFRNPTKR
ncbi:MAG: hypothetical protein IKR26_06425 [Lachnospiraceae bacterium]|nr:hypothetical protein [Lachnospiraceae bacterium]